MTSRYSHTRLSDSDLLRRALERAASDRIGTADFVSLIAEIDVRRIWVPAGYPSMCAFCVEELRLSEDAALKRIRAGRAALEFPAIFEALADGRLNLSAVVQLKPYLTHANAAELLGEAAGKTRKQIELLLARCFPTSELLPMVEAIPPVAHVAEVAPGPPRAHMAEVADRSEAIATQQAPVLRTRLTPTAPERFALHASIGQEAHDGLRRLQELLSHRIPSGDLGEVLDHVIKIALAQVEKTQCAATDRPRASRRRSKNPRYIPAHVRRAVRARDGGQCTFVSEGGKRCSSRNHLQYDHIEPVARGGLATVENIRLRCRAHNQFEAEQVFGKDFMEQKREEARAEQEAKARAVAKERASEVVPYLRRLGFRADEARHAASLCESIPDAPLEARVRLALRHLGPVARTEAATSFTSTSAP